MTTQPRMSHADATESLARYIAKNNKKAQHIRKAYAGLGDDITFSRFVKVANDGRRGRSVAPTNTRILAGTTIFPHSVKEASAVKNVLVSGYNNAKIGRDVRKGKHFRSYWIYTLSLEERATCPKRCDHWVSCYGNNMPFAKRLKHGPLLTAAIEAQLAQLFKPFKNGRPQRVGILIRLHALGDFYSLEYVGFWERMLDQYPRLAIFGYTHRTPGSVIGAAVAGVKERHGRRFAIRWSNGKASRDCAVSIKHAADAPVDSFVCPEQTGGVAGCGKCALCWGTDKNVAFVEH